MILKSSGSIVAAAALVSGVMAVAGAVHATSIGVQFLDANTGYGDNPVNGQMVGAPGFTQSVWNEVAVNDHNANGGYASYNPNWSGAGLSLSDSSGAASSITLSYSSLGSQRSNTYYTFPQSGLTEQEKFLSGGIISFGSGGYVQFNNVPTGSYSLVAYLANNYGDGSYNISKEAAGFSVNGGSPVVTGEQNGKNFTTSGDVYVTSTSPSSSTVLNYLVFSGVTPASGNITLNFKDISGVDVGVNAVQLIAPAGATPEPATVALFGAAGAGILLLSRRRSRGWSA